MSDGNFKCCKNLGRFLAQYFWIVKESKAIRCSAVQMFEESQRTRESEMDEAVRERGVIS